MRIGPRWLAVPATIALAAVAWLWHDWGLTGVWGMVLLLGVVLGFIGTLVTVVRLGERARDSNSYGRNLLQILAVPAAAGLLAGLFLYDGDGLVGSVVLVFLAVVVLVPGAAIATALEHSFPRFEFLRGAGSSLWTLVLAGGVFCGCALPVGCTCQTIAVDRAKSWAEAAAAEVRATESATGRLPESLEEFLPRLGPAPGLLPRPNFGYSPGSRAGEFKIQVRSPGGMFDDWWTLDGRSGRWIFEAD